MRNHQASCIKFVIIQHKFQIYQFLNMILITLKDC